MLDYIYGKVETMNKSVVLAVGGVGFEIFVPATTFDKLKVGENAKLFVKLCVREDSLKLYGFLAVEERTMFEKLQTISGIGPALALNVLSVYTPQALQQAILQEDMSLFKKIKGIGPKIAQRIIMELKGELQKLGLSSTPVPKDNMKKQAANALINLGYEEIYALEAVDKAVSKIPADYTLELLIREALQNLK